MAEVLGSEQARDAAELSFLRSVSEVAGISVPEFVVPDRLHVVARDTRIHCLDWGTAGKPLVLFVHGGAQTAHTWDIVCLALRNRIRCVAPELRGHGDSEWSPELDYGPPAHARDLGGVLDHFDAAGAVLVGMSLGGLSSMYLAAAAPERVRALVVIDAGPNVEPGRGREIANFMGSTGELRTLDDYVEQALRFNPRRDPELLRHSLLYNLRERPEGGYAWKWDPRPMGSATLRQDWERWRQELWERAAGIEAPTLLVRGGDSPMFMREDAEELAAHMPNARWVEVENAGHAVQGDNPAGLLRELEAFFEAERLA